MNPLRFASSLRYRADYLYKFWRERGFRATYNFVIARMYWAIGFFPNLLLKRLAPLIEPYPCLIEVEPSTYCNLKCKMCEHTYWKEPARNMTFEQFKHILSQFPNLKWLGLTGIGESFMNKDFMKMLRYAKSKKIYIELYDTFYFVDRKIAEELIDMGIDRIQPSVDAATKETYENIRVNSDFGRITRNIKTLIDIKKERKLNFPEICFNFVISKLNVHEVPKMVDFVRSLDPDIKKVSFTNLLHPFKEVKKWNIPVIPDEIIKKAEERGKALGIRVGWNFNVKDEELKPPLRDCTFWITPFIFSSGHVIICCASNEANQREWQKKHSFGNIFEKPFKEIWNSKEYRNARRLIRKGICPIQCSTCPSFNLSSGGCKK